MPYLKVLKLDHNPVEWPPKEITGFPLASVTTGHHQRNATGSGSLDGENSGKRSGSSSANKVEDAEEMQRWLPNLINWIKENSEGMSGARLAINDASGQADVFSNQIVVRALPVMTRRPLVLLPLFPDPTVMTVWMHHSPFPLDGIYL